MKPTIFASRTLAQFQNSTVTYDSATVTYDSLTVNYGGDDTVQSIGPNKMSIIQSKPTQQQII